MVWVWFRVSFDLENFRAGVSVRVKLGLGMVLKLGLT